MSYSLLASSFKGPVPSSNHANAHGSPVQMASEFHPRSQSGGRALSWPACNKAVGLPIVMLAALPIPCGARVLGRLTTAGQVAVGVDSSHHWLPGWQGCSHSVPLQVLVPESFLMPSQTWNLLQKMAANEH